MYITKAKGGASSGPSLLDYLADFQVSTVFRWLLGFQNPRNRGTGNNPDVLLMRVGGIPKIMYSPATADWRTVIIVISDVIIISKYNNNWDSKSSQLRKDLINLTSKLGCIRACASLINAGWASDRVG